MVLFGIRLRRVRRRRRSDANDPHYTAKEVKHATSAMVWGCFAFGGVGNLVFLEEIKSVNQHTYFNLLCDNLSESFEKCNVHTTRSII